MLRSRCSSAPSPTPRIGEDVYYQMFRYFTIFNSLTSFGGGYRYAVACARAAPSRLPRPCSSNRCPPAPARICSAPLRGAARPTLATAFAVGMVRVGKHCANRPFRVDGCRPCSGAKQSAQKRSQCFAPLCAVVNRPRSTVLSSQVLIYRVGVFAVRARLPNTPLRSECLATLRAVGKGTATAFSFLTIV